MTASANIPISSDPASFLSDGTRCAVTVFRPETSGESPMPAIVMAHGFGSPRALRLYAYAERFAAAGYAAMVFDYRGFGDSEGEPRQVLDVSMQHDDWKAALEFARTLPRNMPTRSWRGEPHSVAGMSSLSPDTVKRWPPSLHKCHMSVVLRLCKPPDSPPRGKSPPTPYATRSTRSWGENRCTSRSWAGQVI